MSTEIVHKTKVSLPIMSLLGVAFVVLKLTGYIDWSWWLVTLPFWGGLAVFLGVLALVFACAVVVAVVGD